MRTEIFVSQPKGIREVDTSTGELMRAYSRTTGASLPEARRVVLAMLTDAANTQHQGPRSKPEEWPIVDAAETTEQTVAPSRRDKNSFERAIGKTEDSAYHVLDRPGAIEALCAGCQLGRRAAEEVLDGGIEGLPAVPPYAKKGGRGHMFKADDIESWSRKYRARKHQQAADRGKGDARSSGVKVRPHFPAAVSASALADIDSPSAQKMCFGDVARNRVFRQDTHFLSDEYFRSDLFRG